MSTSTVEPVWVLEPRALSRERVLRGPLCVIGWIACGEIRMHDALEKALADALMRRQSPPAGAQPSPQRATVRVLVVDDNDGDADLVADHLMGIASVDFAVERAGRLAEAIEAIASSAPDIVLLDLGLPDSQGTGTFERLRQAADEIPLVVLTGNNDGDVASAVLKAGAQDFLGKGSLGGEGRVRTLPPGLERHRAQLEQRELVRRLAEANQQLLELANTDAL